MDTLRDKFYSKFILEFSKMIRAPIPCSEMSRVPIPRDYPDILDDKPDEFFDFKNVTIVYQDETEFEVGSLLGHGFSSDVYEGRHKLTKKPVIIKMDKDFTQLTIKHEYSILRMLSGGKNIIQCLGAAHFSLYLTSGLILEKLDRSFKTYHISLCEEHIKSFSKQILEALDFCHGKGIIHFDLKPDNIVVNVNTKVIKLIDFGSAFLYRMNTPVRRAACTLPYMAPELLFNYHYFNYAVDIWAFGCILAEMVYYKRPFFDGKNEYLQMSNIVELLGSEEVENFVSKYNVTLDVDWSWRVPIYKQLEVKSFNFTNKFVKVTDFLSMIQSILKFDPEERPTAGEALQNSLFLHVTVPLDPLTEPSSSK